MINQLSVHKISHLLRKGGFKRYVQHPDVIKSTIHPIEPGYRVQQWDYNTVHVNYYVIGDYYRKPNDERNAIENAGHNALREIGEYLKTQGFAVNSFYMFLEVTWPNVLKPYLKGCLWRTLMEN
jgi:hypothetical protein